METNQSSGLASRESALQVTPTSPEMLDAEIPKGWRRGVTAGAVGDWALLPVIVVCSSFDRGTIIILGK